MAPNLVLAVGGMSVLALGVWGIESMPRCRPIVYLLCACGVVLIAIAAAQAGSNWGLRIATLGMFSSAGGCLGGATAAISAKRHAGAILASFGKITTTGFKIGSLIAASGGMIAVVMQAFEVHKPGYLFFLVGQALFFSTSGMQAVIIARGQWSLADRGIIGTNVFVPWRDVSAWNWQDSNTLAIALKPRFLRPRKFKISVATELHESTAAILASRIPA